MFTNYHLVDTTAAGGLLVPEDSIRIVVLAWFIIYICYWNLQFLNNVIIAKAKVLLPPAYVNLADFAYPV